MFRIDSSLIDNMSQNKAYIVLKHKDNIKEIPLETEENEQNFSSRKIIENDKEAIQKAVQEAVLILDKAKREAEDIKQAAWQEGYKKGTEEAEQHAAVKTKAQAKAAIDFIIKLKAYKHSLREDMQKSVLQISLDIAEKIVNTEIKKDDTIYMGIVKKAVDKFDSSEKLKIFISDKEYYKFSKDVVEWLENETDHDFLEVICDHNMQEGDLIVESDKSIVCAGIPLQLDKIRQMLNEDA